jgi:TrmH family RNA methyltransferase
MPVEITSRQNPVVRDCRQLARARDGDRVLLDGAHLLEEALEEDVSIESVIASHDFAAGHQALLSALARRTNVYLAGDDVLLAASPVKTPSGIVAIASLPLSPVSDTLGQQAAGASAFRAAMAVALVDVQDPGNAGAVVRSVEAAGGTGVIASDATTDPRGWRAVRASMGSAFRVPIAEAGTDQVFSDAKVAGVRVIASTLDPASADMRDVTWTEPFILLIGNEARGLPAAVTDRAELRVRVPMFGRVQSMNAAVSAAVILYEAERQRAAAAEGAGKARRG